MKKKTNKNIIAAVCILLAAMMLLSCNRTGGGEQTSNVPETDGRTALVSQTPTEMPTEAPLIPLKKGVRIEAPNEYEYTYDASKGIAYASLYSHAGGNHTFVDAYCFEDVKSPEDVSAASKGKEIYLVRSTDDYRETAWPITDLSKRAFVEEMIENAVFEARHDIPYYSPVCRLSFKDGGDEEYYYIYLAGMIQKCGKHFEDEGKRLFADIDTETLLRTLTIAAEHIRKENDLCLFLGLLTFDIKAMAYEDYALTVKYGDKEKTYAIDEAVEIQDKIFGGLPKKEGQPIVKTRPYVNFDPPYDIDDCIVLTENCVYEGKAICRSCYLGPDGYAFVKYFAGEEGGGTDVRFIEWGGYAVYIEADLATVSLDTYSFDDMLKYAG